MVQPVDRHREVRSVLRAGHAPHPDVTAGSLLSADSGGYGARPALAASLYKDGGVSLGKAAKISGLPLSESVEHLGSLGIGVVRQDETTDRETGDVTAWL